MASTRTKIIVPLLFVVGLALAYMVQENSRHGEMAPVAAGEKAPDFTVQDLEGNKVALSDFRGKLVFLNFWATWCPPCREEMPSMERLYRSMEGKPFKILAVSVDNNVGVVERFRKGRGYTFPVFIDESGKVAALYRTTGVPETFIISPEGTIRAKFIGPVDWASEERLAYLSQLLPKL